MFFKTTAALLVLLATTSAVPYRDWEQRKQEVLYRLWSQAASHGVAAHTQAADVDASDCVAVTQREGSKAYVVRVCTAENVGECERTHNNYNSIKL